jgi:D-serine dehydratase
METLPLTEKSHTLSWVDAAISPLNKGIGLVDSAVAGGDVAGLDWNLLREDVSLPCAVLYKDRLLHNLDWMRRFIAAYGLKLAPHGKTTMAPRLFEMQLGAGAWGITLATAHQTLVAHAHGVRRILMANQLIGKENMAMIARLLQDPGFEFFCLVDSVEQVEQLGKVFVEQGVRLNVLLELGVAGGRAGVRDEKQISRAGWGLKATFSVYRRCFRVRGLHGTTWSPKSFPLPA